MLKCLKWSEILVDLDYWQNNVAHSPLVALFATFVEAKLTINPYVMLYNQ